MDERVYRIVMSQPIPMRLANRLWSAPDPPLYRLGVQRYMRGRMTLRKHYVLLLVSLGWENPRIAAELGLSTETIKAMVRSLMDIYDARNRTHLVALAIRRGDV